MRCGIRPVVWPQHLLGPFREIAMYVLMRRVLGFVLGVLALLGPLRANGQAPYAPVGFGLNPYVNPFAGGGGSPSLGYGGGDDDGGSGHGSSSGGQAVYGGSGGLLSSAISGAAYGYGYGLSNTQWMMNAYQGYLQGAVGVVRANAQYYQTIQQARMTRQELIRSSVQTRRALIEEADWERQRMPDPEKMGL